MALQSKWTDLGKKRLVANSERVLHTDVKRKVSKFWCLQKVWKPRSHFLNSLGTGLLSHMVKNLVIGYGWMWFVYSKRRLLMQLIYGSFTCVTSPFSGWGLMMRIIHAGVAWVWLVRQGCCHTVGVLKQLDCGLGLVFCFVSTPSLVSRALLFFFFWLNLCSQ